MRATIVFPDASEVYRGGDPTSAINSLFERAYVKGAAQARVGSVVVALLEFTKAVVFDDPFDNANYEVFLQATSGVSAAYWASAKTANGFTLNVSLSLSATFSYIAIGVPE